MIIQCLRYTAAVALLIDLSTFAACGSTENSEATGEYGDNAIITAKVKDEVFNDPNLKSSEIKVETFKGKVQLSGYVSTQADIDQAVALTRSVKGVESVSNDMHLK